MQAHLCIGGWGELPSLDCPIKVGGGDGVPELDKCLVIRGSGAHHLCIIIRSLEKAASLDRFAVQPTYLAATKPSSHAVMVTCIRAILSVLALAFA
jgi:hypothetical protein